MTTTEHGFPETESKTSAKDRVDERSKKTARMNYPGRVQSDLYGGIGWILGLLITLFLSIPAILPPLETEATGTKAEPFTFHVLPLG